LFPGTPQSRRILVVDDDRALGEELRASLRVAGFDAEAVSLAAGLTPDFLARFAPGLVLLDSAAGGLRRDTVRTIVLGLRAQLGCRLLVMGAPGPALAARARDVGADGAVDKALLLQTPHAVLHSEGPRDAAQPAPAASQPPPLPRKEAPPPVIVSMIEEELARLGEPGHAAAEPSLHVVVDLFSENNFYITKTTTGRLVGLFVATDLPPAVGTTVRLTVALLGGYRFESRGEVAWVRERSAFASKLPAGAGLRMLQMSDEDKLQVRRFLSQRVPYSYTGA
jgi:Tfp pilus assembly protein PilZ